MSIFDKPTKVAILTDKINKLTMKHNIDVADLYDQKADLYEEMAQELSQLENPNQAVINSFNESAKLNRQMARQSRESAQLWACNITSPDISSN